MAAGGVSVEGVLQSQQLQEAVRAPFEEDLQAISMLWHYSKGGWDGWAEVKSCEISKALSTA